MRCSGAARLPAIRLRKALAATPSQVRWSHARTRPISGEELARRGCQNLADRYGRAGENPDDPMDPSADASISSATLSVWTTNKTSPCCPG